jgi:hypothetical protein
MIRSFAQNFSDIGSAASRSAPVGFELLRVYLQPVAILHQRVADIARLSLLAGALSRQLRIGINLRISCTNSFSLRTEWSICKMQLPQHSIRRKGRWLP